MHLVWCVISIIIIIIIMPQWLDCWVHIPEAVLEIPDGCCICHGDRRFAADI